MYKIIHYYICDISFYGLFKCDKTLFSGIIISEICCFSLKYNEKNEINDYLCKITYTNNLLPRSLCSILQKFNGEVVCETDSLEEGEKYLQQLIIVSNV